MRKPRLILVGEAPGSGSLIGRENEALTGSSGRNLCKIAGWEWKDYLSKTERRNLFYVEIPHEAWRPDLARTQAAFEIGDIAGRGIRVVVLGDRVRQAFQSFLKVEIPRFDWVLAGAKVRRHDFRFTVAAVPHPSGRNRYWNDSANVEEARRFLEGLLS